MAETLEVVRSTVGVLRSPALKAKGPRSPSVGDSEAAALSVDMPGIVSNAGEEGACTHPTHASTLPPGYFQQTHLAPVSSGRVLSPTRIDIKLQRDGDNVHQG